MLPCLLIHLSAAHLSSDAQPASSNVAKFWARLKYATVTDGFLLLEPGTYFLGDSIFGDCVFVREACELLVGDSESYMNLASAAAVLRCGHSCSQFGLHLHAPHAQMSG